jgi:magnesium-protoporphyrin IX monomethyl ester (oxidative) cyclase
LEQCAIANQKLAEISGNGRPGAIQFCQKLPWIVVIVWQLLRLYLLPSIDAEASRTVIN